MEKFRPLKWMLISVLVCLAVLHIGEALGQGQDG
jgi:hypothetical protein